MIESEISVMDLLSPDLSNTKRFDDPAWPRPRVFPVPVRWIKILLDDPASKAVTNGADLTLVIRTGAGVEIAVHPLDFYALDDQGAAIVDHEIVRFLAEQAKLDPDA